MNERFIATLNKSEDGKVIIPFKDRSGEVFGQLCFDPTDSSILGRFEVLRTNIQKAAKRLKRISKINPDGTVSGWDIKSRMLMREVEAGVRDGFEKCFGKGTYESLFSQRRPFASVGGTFFVSNVIKALDKSVFTAEELKE